MKKSNYALCVASLMGFFVTSALSQSCPTNTAPVGTGLRSDDAAGPFFQNRAQADSYFHEYWRSLWTRVLAPSNAIICDLRVDPETDGEMEIGYEMKPAYPYLDENNVWQPPDCSMSFQYQKSFALLQTTLLCKTGYELTTGTFNGVPNTQYCKKKLPALAYCPDEKNDDAARGPCPAGGGSPMIGNPCNAGTGNKFQKEVDYESADGLRIARYYNSSTTTPTGLMGKLWRNEYDRRLEFPAYSGTAGRYNMGNPRVYAHRQDGSVIWFTFDATTATPVREGTQEKLSRIDETTWELRTPDGAKETYVLRANAAQTASFGRLEKITFRGGRTLALTYSAAERIGTVKDSFGKTLTFAYTSGRVSSITDPAGKQILFQYNSSGYLSAAIYPDNTPTNANDNPRRLYNYADTANVGALTSIVDESGVTYAHWTYDTARRATLSEHAGGAEQVTLTYNANGTTTVGSVLGASSVLSFSTLESVPRTTGVQTGGVGGSRAYYSSGFAASTTDPNGNTTSYDVDDRGFELSRTEAVGTALARTIDTSWDSALDVPLTVSEPNRVWTFTYDASGNVLSRTITDTAVAPNTSKTWTFTYNASGRVLTEDGPRTDVNDTTTFTYYACSTGAQCGQLSTVTNALGHVTTFNAYNAHGMPTQITDPNGVVTNLAYDLLKQITDKCVGAALPTCSGGQLTHFDYWPTRLLKKVTNPDGSSLEFTYDAAHRLTELKDGLNNKVVYGLDSAGNRTSVSTYDPSNALRRTHTRVFNSLSQLWKEINAAGTANVTTTFGYDNNGNRVNVAAPLGRTRSNSYDEFNRLKQISDPASGITQFAYDANDNLISVTDPRSLVTSYSYSGLGELLTVDSPDTGLTTNTYDSGGNLSTSTDARGASTTFTYDSLDRMSSMSYALGGVTDQSIAYSYDGGTNQRGHLTGANDANHSMTFSYNPRGQLTAKTQTVAGLARSIAYGYNSAGQLTSTTLPSGANVSFGYNLSNQVTSVVLNGSTTILSGVTRDPFGPVTGWTWGNGTTTSRGYDYDGNITQVDTAAGSSLKVYSYDDAARVTGISDAGNAALSWTYGYDALDRLTSATRNAVSQGWSYDANGNRLAETGIAPSTFNVASGSNRIDSVTGSIPRTYGYDFAGHTTSYAGASFNYNARGRLSSVSYGGVSANYVYNVFGQRIARTAGGVTSVYVFDEDGRLVGEYASSGALVQEIVWLGDIPIATLRPNGAGVAVYYIHTDHLNTPRRITDSANNLRWVWESDAFGVAPPDEDPSSLGAFKFDLRYPGQQYDGIVGLYYNYFRDFDPATGGYIESDPFGLFGGPSTYGYVRSSPIRFTDRLGLAEDSISDTIEISVARGDVARLNDMLGAGGLSPAQESAAQAGLRNILNRLTNNTKKLAELLGKKEKEIRQAIERCKQQGLPRNGPIRNPDVKIDPVSGEVFPELEGGGLGDTIGNIMDYL